ncbi:MAG TPA: response regulator [Draconibacterium sp.]|nr:response regulator [Draconibacterium sp.]
MTKPKILYVDDEPINLLLFEANLDRKYEVLKANNGLEGLAVIADHPDIKIVFSDMKMPNMNGIEFIKEASKIISECFFYILTGFEITNEIQHSLDSGLIQKYYGKPTNMKDILNEIEAVLNHY